MIDATPEQMEGLAALHPAAQVALIVGGVVIVCVMFLSFFTSFFDRNG